MAASQALVVCWEKAGESRYAPPSASRRDFLGPAKKRVARNGNVGFHADFVKKTKKMIKIARQCCKEKERVGAFGGGLPWNLGLDPIPPSARYWGGGGWNHSSWPKRGRWGHQTFALSFLTSNLLKSPSDISSLQKHALHSSKRAW